MKKHPPVNGKSSCIRPLKQEISPRPFAHSRRRERRAFENQNTPSPRSEQACSTVSARKVLKGRTLGHFNRVFLHGGNKENEGLEWVTSFLCFLRYLYVKALFHLNVDFVEARFVERIGVAGLREENVRFQGLEPAEQVAAPPNAVDAGGDAVPAEDGVRGRRTDDRKRLVGLAGSSPAT